MAVRLFGREADIASAQAGKMITDQITKLGLREEQFSRMPVGPRRLRGVQEVGWNVQGEGPLSKMVDLLFVLEQTPQIHRLENVVFSTADRPGRIKLRFRYLTLVIDSAPVVTAVDLKPKCGLESPERSFYDAIIQRDLLRPYFKREAASLQSDPSPPSAADSTAPAGNRPEMLKIVSLSQWQGTAEVHLCDLNTMKVTRLKPGDPLAEGQIVMIDYRTRPLRDKPELLSSSRVILKIGQEYWAVENGQTLNAKYLLTPELLPAELTPLSNPQK
jgi:hypothetical protein